MAKGTDTKSKILDTALEIAAKAGFQGMSIGSLAKAVGMSKSGLFAHFQSKDNLQLMVMQRAADEFTEKVLSPSFKNPRGEPRIRAMFENWLQYLKGKTSVSGGDILISTVRELDSQPGPVRDFAQKIQWDLVGNIQKACEFAKEEGHFKSDLDSELFAWNMYALFMGFHHFNRLLEDEKAKEHLSKSFENLMRTSQSLH